MYSLIKKRLLKSIKRLKKGAQPSQNKQVLVLCVALRRHPTFTESKHNAAFLTNS